MDIVKSAKEIGSSVEEKIEHGLEVAKETFANVASHLPFANLAKKGSDTFSMLQRKPSPFKGGDISGILL